VIDLYCERTGPGLWGEPLNVLTSAAYLAAGIALIRLVRRQQRPDAIVCILAWLPVAIAAGSGLFHALATPWARVFDEAPILLFQLLFLGAYARRFALMSRATVVVLLGAFLGAVVSARAAGGLLNGSLPYLPALVVATTIGVWHARMATSNRLLPIAGAAVLAVAILCRTMDNAACGAFPSGTHFIWHLLTAVVLYLFGLTLMGVAPRAHPIDAGAVRSDS
jgi:hypothetical protein